MQNYLKFILLLLISYNCSDDKESGQKLKKKDVSVKKILKNSNKPKKSIEKIPTEKQKIIQKLSTKETIHEREREIVEYNINMKELILPSNCAFNFDNTGDFLTKKLDIDKTNFLQNIDLVFEFFKKSKQKVIFKNEQYVTGGLFSNKFSGEQSFIITSTKNKDKKYIVVINYRKEGDTLRESNIILTDIHRKLADFLALQQVAPKNCPKFFFVKMKGVPFLIREYIAGKKINYSPEKEKSLKFDEEVSGKYEELIKLLKHNKLNYSFRIPDKGNIYHSLFRENGFKWNGKNYIWVCPSLYNMSINTRLNVNEIFKNQSEIKTNTIYKYKNLKKFLLSEKFISKEQITEQGNMRIRSIISDDDNNERLTKELINKFEINGDTFKENLKSLHNFFESFNKKILLNNETFITQGALKDMASQFKNYLITSNNKKYVVSLVNSRNYGKNSTGLIQEIYRQFISLLAWKQVAPDHCPQFYLVHKSGVPFIISEYIEKQKIDFEDASMSQKLVDNIKRLARLINKNKFNYSFDNTFAEESGNSYLSSLFSKSDKISVNHKNERKLAYNGLIWNGKNYFWVLPMLNTFIGYPNVVIENQYNKSKKIKNECVVRIDDKNLIKSLISYGFTSKVVGNVCYFNFYKNRKLWFWDISFIIQKDKKGEKFIKVSNKNDEGEVRTIINLILKNKQFRNYLIRFFPLDFELVNEIEELMKQGDNKIKL